MTCLILGAFFMSLVCAADHGTAKPVTIENKIDLSKAVVDGWDAISPIYLEHKSTLFHPGDLVEAPVFQNLIEKYAKNAQLILDAGTGNGWFTNSLLRWNILGQLHRIIGIDISPAMIATARAQCLASRAEFFCGDLNSSLYQEIGLEKNSVDLVISSNAIDCMENVDQVLMRLYQLLKPGSCAIVSMRHPLRNAYYLTGSRDGHFEESVYTERWTGTGSHEVIRFYRKEETWDRIFKSCGFGIVEKQIPVISEKLAEIHPEHYRHYKNKKHPGALIYVLRKPRINLAQSGSL